MTRYVIKPQRPPRADDDYHWRPMHQLGHPSVFFSDPVPTGLLDADGNQIYRSPDPVGFLRKT